MSRLEFNFSAEVNGVLWSTWPVPGHTLMVVEERNEAARLVSFSLLDYSNGTWLWRNKSLEESWWVTVAAATSSVLLLHIYEGIQSPELTTLVALDLPSGDFLWKKAKLTFAMANETMMVGSMPDDERTRICVDLRSGMELTEKNETNITANEISDVVKPFQYLDGTDYFETVRSFAEAHLGLTIVSSVEYLERDGFVFLSIHTNEEGLASYLFVLTTTGEILLKEKTNTNLKGITVETFFLLSGWLIFVKNGKELLSYKLV